MLTMDNRAPDGFTYVGMQRGWMKRKKTPMTRKLERENAELRESLAEIMKRLEKIEEDIR